jgi:hypothetical protein
MTKRDDDMDKPVTRRELREELEQYPKRTELEMWGGALNAKIDAVDAKVDAVDAKVDAVDAKVDALGIRLDGLIAEFNAFARLVKTTFDELALELARHANRILESVHDIAGVVDEKYKDLPARVVRLENTVFRPKRQRRR